MLAGRNDVRIANNPPKSATRRISRVLNMRSNQQLNPSRSVIPTRFLTPERSRREEAVEPAVLLPLVPARPHFPIGHDTTGITNKASAHPPCAVILTRSGRICGCSFSRHRHETSQMPTTRPWLYFLRASKRFLFTSQLLASADRRRSALASKTTIWILYLRDVPAFAGNGLYLHRKSVCTFSRLGLSRQRTEAVLGRGRYVLPPRCRLHWTLPV